MARQDPRLAPWQEGPLPDERTMPELRNVHRSAHNGWYAVLFSEQETAWGPVLHLWIRNRPNTDIPWAEKQRIKDELVGRERTAIEVFPPQGQLVDSANMYHLWVLPVGMQIPFGLHQLTAGSSARAEAR